MIKFDKIRHDPRKYFDELSRALEKDSDIIAAYIFGSYATGNINPLSDVDIAVLLNKKICVSSYFDKRLDLFTMASNILKTDELDIVILNEASLILAHRVFKLGRLLFCKDDLQRVRFQTSIIDKYLDTEPLRKQGYDLLLKRIKEGKFGT